MTLPLLDATVQTAPDIGLDPGELVNAALGPKTGTASGELEVEVVPEKTRLYVKAIAADPPDQRPAVSETIRSVPVSGEAFEGSFRFQKTLLAFT